MSKYPSLTALLSLVMASPAFAQQEQAGTTAGDRTELGRLASRATVAFVRAGTGDWGIEISGGTAPRLSQPKPAQIEVFAGGENVRPLAAGYYSVKQEGDAVVATAKVAGEGQAAFAVEDRWTVTGAVLSLSRKVNVTGAETNAGFFSAIRLSTAPTVKWEDVKCLIPGLFYGEPHGGRLNSGAKRFTVREDYLSAPLLAFQFQDGNLAAVLDPAPRGDTTQAETTAPAATPIVDERIQFGALGTREIPDGGIELGFWLPGTTTDIGGGFGMRGADSSTPTVRRRYHPVKQGFAQNYQVAFRFDRSDSFRNMEREAWRCSCATRSVQSSTGCP